MAEKLHNQVLAPTAENWQLAELRDTASEVVADDLQLPYQLDYPERTIIGLPAHCFSSVPISVQRSPDQDAIAEMLQLQLEKLGLSGDFRNNASYEIVDQQESSEIYHTVVLDDTIPEELCIENAARFEPAVHLRAISSNTLTLFIEMGQVVAAIDLGGKLAHFEALGSLPDSEDLASEVSLLLLSVGETLPVEKLKSIQIGFNLDDRVLQQIADSTGLAAKTIDPPKLRSPDRVWAFLPQQVSILRLQTKRKKQLQQMVFGLAAVLIIAFAAMAAHLIMLNLQVAELENDLAAHAQEVDATKSTANLWRRMELALTPESFPIERLYQAARLLPEQGVRMTVFEQRGGDVVIAGEASSTPAAIKFSNDLKRSPDWSGFNWEIPPPKILPNNSAQFRITARRMDQLGQLQATP